MAINRAMAMATVVALEEERIGKGGKSGDGNKEGNGEQQQ
jgi:hypothetical protein